MTPRPDITQPKNMLQVQGDRVAVYRHGPTGLVLAHILTLIHRIDHNQHEMRMVNRESKERKPDWAFTQKWYDRLRPESDSRLKTQWAVTIKT